MASPSTAEQGDDVSVMGDPVVYTITGMSGREANAPWV
jgi:hypothetical protein